MSPAGSWTVLVDGYNVIKRHGPWRRLTPQDGRTRLLALVSGIGWPVPVLRAVIVFDGRVADATAVHSTGAMEVRFASTSAGEPAEGRRAALPAAEARRITEELAKRWLGKE